MFLPQVQLMELVEALVGVQSDFFRGKKREWLPPILEIPKSHS